MPTVADLYRYATLATAAYVRLGGGTYSGANLAVLARIQSEGRLPFSIATELFNPADPKAARWTIARYFGADLPDYPDKTGFAATLFKKDGENVLAIRGVEPTVSVTDAKRDLLGASIGGIGLLGVALNQLLDLVNLIQRLYGTGAVTQLRAGFSLTRPDSTGAHFVELKGPSIPNPAGPIFPDIQLPLYLTLSTYEAQGVGALAAGERITLTGHSLGGHLAMAAAQILGSRINPDVYLFNSADFAPQGVDVVAAGSSLLRIVGAMLNDKLVQRCDAKPQVSVVQAAGRQGLHRLRDLSKESARVLSLRA